MKLSNKFLQVGAVALCCLCGTAHAAIDVDGQVLEVIDVHLHTGNAGTMPASAKEYLSSSMVFGGLFFPAIAEYILDPYGANIGVAENMKMAGVDHGFLLGTYTHYTTGYETNSDLEDKLNDARNVDSMGEPLYWGMPSINFDDLDDTVGFAEKCDVLRTYFEQRPDLFVGIKLAHAHQGVAFNDARHHPVYEVAAEFGVPVLLHSGFSPFPGSMDSPEYYDPIYLEEVIQAYDGLDESGHLDPEEPVVVFVFAHAGQGDKRSIQHTLQLASQYPNVYFDTSALNGRFKRDEDGKEITEEEVATDPDYDPVYGQLIYVYSQVKTLGLADRVLWATDGPQYMGMIDRYLTTSIDAMKEVGITVDEMRQILAGNARRIFLNKK
jgi:predicted TIM-barrel fold metal-dependent hydrolase